MRGQKGVRVGEVVIGGGAPLALIGGLNVLEDEAGTIACARTVAALGARHGLPVILKASFDKANSTRLDAYRGPGLDECLRMLAAVKRATGLPLLTDVHQPAQAKRAAEVAAVVDVLQTPAFLCRQTNFIVSVCSQGRPVNIKKGPFLSPWEIAGVVEKARSTGNEAILVCERGFSFSASSFPE